MAELRHRLLGRHHLGALLRELRDRREKLNEDVGTALPQDGPRTLAGLAFEALGRRPRPGDTVELAGAQLRVEELDGLRIAQLRVTPPGAAA